MGYFQGEGHLAMVKKLCCDAEDHDPTYELVGVVTLEDIVEEILQVSFCSNMYCFLWEHFF